MGTNWFWSRAVATRGPRTYCSQEWHDKTVISAQEVYMLRHLFSGVAGMKSQDMLDNIVVADASTREF